MPQIHRHGLFLMMMSIVVPTQILNSKPRLSLQQIPSSQPTTSLPSSPVRETTTRHKHGKRGVAHQSTTRHENGATRGIVAGTLSCKDPPIVPKQRWMMHAVVDRSQSVETKRATAMRRLAPRGWRGGFDRQRRQCRQLSHHQGWLRQ